MIKVLNKKDFPLRLLEIPKNAIPSKLYYRGDLSIINNPNLKYLCIVGSRKNTHYGKEVVEKLIAPLKDYGIVIISGLAYGIDTIAHTEALKHKIPTIALPGSGISPGFIYPKAHERIATQIIESGGLIISEFEPEATPQPWFFPQRNRLMAGLADAVLIIESTDRSGTLITAKLALDYNRSVLAVPGSVFSPHSLGTNSLIQQGAEVVCSHIDILKALNINEIPDSSFTETDKNFLSKIDGRKTTYQIAAELGMSPTEASTTSAFLCFKGIIEERYDIPKLKT